VWARRRDALDVWAAIGDAERGAVTCAGSAAVDGGRHLQICVRKPLYVLAYGQIVYTSAALPVSHDPRIPTMMHPKPLSLMRELALAIVPLFFGVFLFAALLETYKDDMSSRKDLVLDFYRPMREAQTECRATEQRLMVAYGAQSGTYKLMLDEFDHMVSADSATLTRDYEVLPRSILESNNQIIAQVGDLKTKLDTCIRALYRKYEEVALATGTYDRFIDIARQRDADLRTPYAQRAALLDEAAAKFKPESMMNTLRQSLMLDTDTADGKAAMKVKLHAVGSRLWTSICDWPKMSRRSLRLSRIRMCN
jgi:hypothetical protein